MSFLYTDIKRIPTKVVFLCGDSEEIIYDSINISHCTADFIRSLLIKKNVKKPNVIDNGDSFLFAYENHRPLYIMKSDGKVYCSEDTKEARIDCTRLLRIFNSYGLVKGFKRVQHRIYKPIKGWIEN